MTPENFSIWIKSERSGEEANCVELSAGIDGTLGVRDSKNPDDDHLVLDGAKWHPFQSATKRGRYDMPKQ